MSDRITSIQIEHETTSENDETPRGKSKNRGRALLAGAVALATIVIAIFALRPDAGEAADGNVREAPTTTTEPPATPSTTEAQPPLVAVAIELESAIRGVVQAEIGYLGVLDTAGPRALPPIVRSVDGLAWNSIEAEVIEGDDLDLVRSRFAVFLGLRATSGEFTILRVRESFAEPGRTSTGFFVVDRLVSSDGLLWEPDATFEEVVVRQSISLTTGSGALLLNTFGPIPTTSAIPSFREAISNLDCSPRGSSLDLLFLENCGGGSSSAGDAANDAPNQQAACAFDYFNDVEAATSLAEFRIIDDDGASGTFSATGLLTSPQVIPESGLIAALARPIPAPPLDCPVASPVEDRPLGIHVWSGPGESTYVPLANLASSGIDDSELATAVAIGPSGEALLIATVDNLVRVELDGTVELLADLGPINLVDGVPAALPVANGINLVDVRDGVLRRWTITDSDATVVEEPVFEQAGFEKVIYADDNVIVTFSPNTDRAIRIRGAS